MSCCGCEEEMLHGEIGDIPDEVAVYVHADIWPYPLRLKNRAHVVDFPTLVSIALGQPQVKEEDSRKGKGHQNQKNKKGKKREEYMYM
jgi:hypothetical protein